MMLTKQELQAILDQTLDTGADFAEIFLEDTRGETIRVNNGEVSAISHTNTYGAGVRLICGDDEVYGYTNDTSYESVLNLANNLKQGFNKPANKAVKLGNKKPYQTTFEIPFDSVSLKEKAAKVAELSSLMKSESDKVVQAITVLLQEEQDVLIVNTNGVYQDDKRVSTRVVLQVAVSDGTNMYDSFSGPGRACGLEFFDLIDLKTIAKETVESALILLGADDMEAQVMPVILHNGFGGVIFHEACGHPLEATNIVKGLSPFVGKVGEKVASDIVTAIDDGTIEGAWGHLSFDDEGMPTQKNILIEDGVLKSYLVDYKSSKKLGIAATGSGRRQSYKYPPTSRMNSTYIAAGNDTLEEIIKDTKFGLFAKKLGGGSVQPATGEFNFVVTEGYMVENGKITKPVRGATLIGQGADVLFKIDKVANNLELGQGVCGAASGAIHTDVGQPTIRVSSMTVGGAGGKSNV